MTREYDVLGKQCAQLLSLVDEFGEDDWQRPTRCRPMTVKDLVVHVAHAAMMTAALAASDMSGHAPNVDRAKWWVSPNRRPPADILAEAQTSSASLDGPGAQAMVADAVARLLRQLSDTPADAIVGNEWRCIRADELAGSRILEIGVHTMDLGHATLRGERIEPESAMFVAGILDTLLAEPLPQGLGWDDRTFILTGTGRRELLNNERYVLGPLADRFPLLR